MYKKKRYVLMNPFAINQNISATSFMGNPYIGGGQPGGIGGAQSPKGPVGGVQTGPTAQQEIADVAFTGMNKRADFENGLGGSKYPPHEDLGLGQNLWAVA